MRALALALLGLLACDQRPVLYAEIRVAPGFPALDTFPRLTLGIDTCDAPAPTLHELDATPDADGTSPERELELELLPNTKSALWLAAWEACDAAQCASVGEQATTGCVCRPGKTPERVAIAYEACSAFERVDAGSELRVSLTLTATAGLCPTPKDKCP